jgi:LysR family transcriptional regulator, regulator for bpeEF and oprC
MLKLEDLDSFARVAAVGSFVGAGRALGVTASAASKAVARIEQQLGLKLFVRTTRSVRLTEAGGAVLERAQRVLTELDAVSDLAASVRGDPRGILRLDVPLSLGVRRVMPLLPELCQRFPELTLEVRASDRIADLVGEDVDVALRVGHLEDAALLSRRLGSSRVVTLASSAYLRRHGRPRSPQDLAGHRCLVFRSTNSGRVLPWRFSGKAGTSSFVPERSHVFSSTVALLAAAEAGLGVAQLLDFSAEAALASRRVMRVLPQHQADGPPISLVYRAERASLPRIRAFCDFLVERW